MSTLFKFHKVFWISLVSYIVISVSGWFLFYQPYHFIQHFGVQHSQLLENRSALINQLTNELGYTGFIYHYKNYLIRRHQNDIDNAMTSLDNAFITLNTLKPLYSDPQDLNTLHSLNNVLIEYQQKIQWLLQNQSHLTKLDANELDQRATVDDSSAAIALQTLITTNQKQMQTTSSLATQKYRTFTLLLVQWWGALTIIYWIATAYFIRHTLKASSLNKHLSAINDLSPSAMIMTSSEGRIISANLKFRNMFKVENDIDLKNLKIEDFIPQIYRDKHEAFRARFLKSDRMSAMEERGKEFFGQRLNGEIFPADISVASIDGEQGKTAIAIIHDKTNETRLESEANTDFLTNTHNRKYAEEQLNQALYNQQRYKHPLCVMLIDIDNFKLINDQYGHDAGDQVLIATVNLLQKHIRQSDILSRWGGDEFIIVLPNTAIDDALILARKILALTKSLTHIEGQHITLSIGLTQAQDDQSAKDILKVADTALYLSKEGGRDRVSLSLS